MEFLLNYGLNENDIRDIQNEVDNDILKNIELNQKNVIEIIEYLNEIGINDMTIKDLFLKQIGIFHRTKNEIASVFDEYELDSIIKSLNYDVNTVDLIEFN